MRLENACMSLENYGRTSSRSDWFGSIINNRANQITSWEFCMMRLRLTCVLFVLIGTHVAQKGPVRIQLTPLTPKAVANSPNVQLAAHEIFFTDLGKPTTGPALTATWTSSNLAVASVNNSGLVTGKTSGSAIITAVRLPFPGSPSVT